MERESSKLMTPFDCQTIPQWIHILKLVLPYTPQKYQHILAVFIRFQEMQFTMRHFQAFTREKHFENLINDVKPYMDSSAREMMEQMESMMNLMEMMQMMQDFSQDTTDDSGKPQGMNPLDILSGLTGNDLSEILNMNGVSQHE